MLLPTAKASDIVHLIYFRLEAPATGTPSLEVLGFAVRDPTRGAGDRLALGLVSDVLAV